MKKTFFLLLVLLSFQHHSFSQDQHLVDSFETQLKNHNAKKLELGKNAPAMYDTTAANILYDLSKAHWGNNPDNAIDYATQCLTLSEQLDYKKGRGNAYNSLAVINDIKGEYSPALEFHTKALKIRQEIGDKTGIAGSYNNIGNIYLSLGNYPESLKNFLSTLKIGEEMGDKKAITAALRNIGNINIFQKNYTEALKNYFASLKISEETGDKNGISISYMNIGNIYFAQGNYPEALKNYFASLKIREEIGDKQGIGDVYNNIGSIYMEQGNYPEALKNHFASLKIREEIGYKQGIAGTYANIGVDYYKQKKYNDASVYLNKALSLAKEIGSLEDIKFSYEGLASLDSAQGNFKQALAHYKLFIATRDSLVNKENTRKITQHQMQYDFDKKESLTKAEQEKKDAIAKKELQRQKLVRNSFFGGFVLMLLFAGVFFTQRNKIKKGKKLSDELLLNILPSEVAEELKQKGAAEAKQFDNVTVMFTDFKDFTQISEKLSPSELVAEIDTCFKAFDNIISRHNIEKIKTIGDSYMCAGGLPVINKTNATDVVNAAIEIRQFIQEHLQQRIKEGKEPFEIRIGVHTGPVVAGIVGVKKFAYDIWGDTVNIASRMESSSEAGKVNISGTTYQLVKDKFTCTHRGKIQAKHKGEVDMYFVETNS